ncbi:MAG: Plasmid pRiA4b ORF-3 family protein [Microgenomates group bacterium GW2011_GWA2_44_7]|nr:MAG: Plasmid pRiA4b ORF-3 family protein [Microgenomates group bacterium GW2011_GWA2_44_7]
MELTFTIPQKHPFTKVYQLKVTLLETKPPVWRRILVPESYTFYDLHVAIQDAMGWTDSHLHCFEKRNSKIRYGDYEVRIDCPYAVDEYEQEGNVVYGTEIPLTDYFKKPNGKLFYTYDFGDNWRHEVVLEEILHKDTRRKYPMCIDGQLACPPEDCGSIPGYYQCIQTLKDKRDKDLLVWIGDWNPEYFDPKGIVFQNPRKRFLETME